MSQMPSNDSATPPAGGSTAAQNGISANGMKRRRVLRVLLALAILGGIVTLIYWLNARRYETTDDAFIEGHVAFMGPKVSGQVLELHVTDNQFVKKDDILVTIDPRDYEARLQQAQGALKAAEAQSQAAKTNRELTEVTAPADTRLAQAGVDAAKSAVDSARSQVQMAKSQQVQAQAAVDSAKAWLEQAKADAVAAQADAKRTDDELARYREMVKTNSATPQQLDDAISSAKSTAARYSAAQKKITASEAQVAAAEAAAKTAAEGITQAQAMAQHAESAVGQAQAKFAQAEPFAQRIALAESYFQASQAQSAQLQAAVESARLQLEYCTIRAPMDGYVTRRTVEQGAYLQPGQPMLAIVDPQVWVVANFKETQLERMKPGQPVTVSIDVLDGKELKAHVDSIMTGAGARFSLLPAENATGNYIKVVQRVPVKIVFDEPVERYKLGPGTSVAPSVKVR